jgi:hypothetical protein
MPILDGDFLPSKRSRARWTDPPDEEEISAVESFLEVLANEGR